MSTTAPKYAIVQVSSGGPKLGPEGGSESDHPDYALALIAIDDSEWSMKHVFQSAKVMINESSLPAAGKAFQARCVADLSIDPVDLPLFTLRGEQIGTGRDLGLLPYDPANGKK